MDWIGYYPDGLAMVDAAQEKIFLDQARLRFVNGRYKRYNEPESPWLYNITFAATDDGLVLCGVEDDVHINVAFAELEYLRLRPFYKAACIGNKSYIFYPHPEELIEWI